MTDQRHPDHVTVLLRESVLALNVKPGSTYIDCTLGGGGHAEAILESASPDGRLLGLDADPVAVTLASHRLAQYHQRLALVNANFASMREVAEEQGYCPADGIIFDLGLSTMQLDKAERGFSFQSDAPLDMRFGPRQTLTAANLVNESSEFELADLIFRYGEEPASRRIAKHIVQIRPIHTTFQLAAAVSRAMGGKRGKIHPATRTFQALRIAVNEELENLQKALSQALDILAPSGRLVVISFHSLEDRIVKEFMRQESKGCICPPKLPQCVCGRQPTVRLITRKVVTASANEVDQNPRSRSAKLRACEKLA